jgi:hypothetical protein
VKPRKLDARKNHTSHILSREDAGNLDDSFLDAKLFVVKMADDCFLDTIQFLNIGMDLADMMFA